MLFKELYCSLNEAFKSSGCCSISGWFQSLLIAKLLPLHSAPPPFHIPYIPAKLASAPQARHIWWCLPQDLCLSFHLKRPHGRMNRQGHQNLTILDCIPVTPCRCCWSLASDKTSLIFSFFICSIEWIIYTLYESKFVNFTDYEWGLKGDGKLIWTRDVYY